MVLIFIGASGSGKGTQAKMLASKYGYCHISTGDLLREAINNKTKQGIEAEKYILEGKWVPNEIVVDLLKQKIETEENAKGFILDGYPRNLVQAKSLDMKVDLVINFNNDLDRLTDRLTGRRTCNACGKITHINENNTGKCDVCGSVLTIRTDDKPEIIKNRFETYIQETVPVIDYYREKGIVADIDADLNKYNVSKQIEKAIRL